MAITNPEFSPHDHPTGLHVFAGSAGAVHGVRRSGREEIPGDGSQTATFFLVRMAEATDPHEDNNVAVQHPDVVRIMQDMLARIRDNR
jgi:hypothetical protein